MIAAVVTIETWSSLLEVVANMVKVPPPPGSGQRLQRLQTDPNEEETREERQALP